MNACDLVADPTQNEFSFKLWNDVRRLRKIRTSDILLEIMQK